MLGGCLGGEESAVDRRRSRFECAGSHRWLDWAGREMDAYYASMDLLGAGGVSWASDDPVPIWFDVAQDLTERWVHQMQIREAVDRVENYPARYLTVVLRTFVWAFRYQYRVDAPAGTLVQI